jgi:hypothetical protein
MLLFLQTPNAAITMWDGPKTGVEQAISLYKADKVSYSHIMSSMAILPDISRPSLGFLHRNLSKILVRLAYFKRASKNLLQRWTPIEFFRDWHQVQFKIGRNIRR